MAACNVALLHATRCRPKSPLRGRTLIVEVQAESPVMEKGLRWPTVASPLSWGKSLEEYQISHVAKFGLLVTANDAWRLTFGQSVELLEVLADHVEKRRVYLVPSAQESDVFDYQGDTTQWWFS